MSARAHLGSHCSSLLFAMDPQDGFCTDRPTKILAVEQIDHLRALLTPQTDFESRLRQDVWATMESIMREDGQIDIVVLASRLVLIGHKVSIRTAMGGGSGQECFRNLNYEFLLVSQLGSEGRELIVDARFREQFKLSQQTYRYTQLLSLLPDAFVGHHNRIVSLVKLLAIEMETAFIETGITMPPWRQASSMMSKWKPLKSKDTEVSTPRLGGASPRGALSLCSSRSSSSCSDCSPQRLRTLLNSGLQRQESIPRRIQSGFTVEAKPAFGKIPEHLTINKNESWPQRSLCDSQIRSTCAEYTAKAAGHNQKAGLRPVHSSMVGELGKNEMGLAKIRTVKLGVR